MRAVHLGALVGVCVFAGGVATGVAATKATTSVDGYASTPTGMAHAHETEVFDSPDAMATAADAVVVADVIGSHPGRTRGEAPELSVDRLVDLRIVRVLSRGSTSDAVRVGALVQLLEGYWETDGDGFVVNDVQWSSPGARGLYFLHLVEGETIYRPVSSYGRLLYGDRQVPDGTSGHEPDKSGPWADTSPNRLDELASAEAVVADAVAETRS